MVMACEKNSKSNETTILAQGSHGRWIFFLDLGLKQAFFYAKNFSSLNITDFTYYLSYIIAKKNGHFFSRSRTSITNLPINFTTSESLFLCPVFRKEFAIFMFLSAISEKQEITISETFKFTGSIYRILKSQKTISMAKVPKKYQKIPKKYM